MDKSAVAIAEVHAAAFAITVHIAVGTLVAVHPFAVAVNLKAVFPHIHEIVFINIALMIVGADAGTSRDIAVDEHRPYGYARLAEKTVISHIQLIFTDEPLASVCADDTASTACFGNEIEQLAEMLVGKE